MAWYAVHCASGLEQSVCNKVKMLLPQNRTYLPMRQLSIRRSGEVLAETMPLFPGYFFIQFENSFLSYHARDIIKKWRSFYPSLFFNILGLSQEEKADSNKKVRCVRPDEMQTLFSLTGDHGVVMLSTYVREGDTIRVIDGPLKGQEGIVVKTNKRKKRVKVSLGLMGKPFVVDIAAELVA